MENLYQLINNFNTDFGHPGKLIPSGAGQRHLWFHIEYHIPIDTEKIKSQKEWANDSVTYLGKNNFGMCKVWIDHDESKPYERPKFVVWNDNIYVNPYTMPDYDLVQEFYETRKHFFDCEANVLVGKSEVYLSDKIIQQFMLICKHRIEACKDLLCCSSNTNTIKEYAQKILDHAEILELLELEMKAREKEKAA